MRELNDLLDHLPTLLKVYGKWPSYAVLLLGAAHGFGALVLVVVLHYVLR